MQAFPSYRYDGDKDAAAALRLVAQNLLHQAREIDKVSASRITKLNRSTPMGEVEVLIIEGQEYVNLLVRSGESGRVKEKATWYIDVLSGLLREVQVVNDGGTAKLRDYNPTQDAFEKPLQAARGKEPGKFHDEELLVPPAGSAKVATASMFSGLMAKLVQLLNGYGRIDLHSHPTASPLNASGNVLREGVDPNVFSPLFEKTHGLIRNPGNKAVWMVEIGRAGLFAAPLPLLDVTADELTVDLPVNFLEPEYEAVREAVKLFGGMPSGAKFDEETPGRITLMTEGQMAAFYADDCYAPHDLMGWTFNERGDEACNIRARLKQTLVAAVPLHSPSTYVFSSLWELRFSFEDGVPRANLNMLEERYVDPLLCSSGLLYSGRIGGARFDVSAQVMNLGGRGFFSNVPYENTGNFNSFRKNQLSYLVVNRPVLLTIFGGAPSLSPDDSGVLGQTEVFNTVEGGEITSPIERRTTEEEQARIDAALRVVTNASFNEAESIVEANRAAQAAVAGPRAALILELTSGPNAIIYVEAERRATLAFPVTIRKQTPVPYLYPETRGLNPYLSPAYCPPPGTPPAPLFVAYRGDERVVIKARFQEVFIPDIPERSRYESRRFGYSELISDSGDVMALYSPPSTRPVNIDIGNAPTNTQMTFWWSPECRDGFAIQPGISSNDLESILNIPVQTSLVYFLPNKENITVNFQDSRRWGELVFRLVDPKNAITLKASVFGKDTHAIYSKDTRSGELSSTGDLFQPAGGSPQGRFEFIGYI